jgi:hypothetical protein
LVERYVSEIAEAVNQMTVGSYGEVAIPVLRPKA